MVGSHRSFTSRVHFIRSPHRISITPFIRSQVAQEACASTLLSSPPARRHGALRAGRFEGCLAGGPKRDAVGFAGVCGGGLGYASKSGPGSRAPARGLPKFALRQVAKAWALREVWKEQGRPTYGMYTFIAQKVTKVGGGHPLPEAVKKLLENADEDLCR